MSTAALPTPDSAVLTEESPLSVPNEEDVLSRFQGTLPHLRQSPMYGVGMALVALFMVLLPVVYLALIAAVAYSAYWHLLHDTWWIQGSGRALVLTFLVYLSPAALAGLLVLFMIKPLLARPQKRPAHFSLLEADQPALFAFIRRICELTGAPKPKAVEVDCEVNASASFKHGFWSLFLPGDLRLIIGLPLVAGMELQQLAGVLAHEFGHFTQGAGMRLTYVIRSINSWFARVVYERDSWDQWLEDQARSGDWRIKTLFTVAKWAVWLTRRILWALMMLGHGISSFMLRQMEFDADSYETRVAGSEVFATTSSRIRELSLANQWVIHGLEESYRTRRLPDDFAAFLVGRVCDVPDEVMSKVRDSVATEKTGWFDSHPCDADRIKAAAKLDQKGIFHTDAPASSIFNGFDGLSKAVTAHHYARILDLPMKDLHLIDTGASTREAHEKALGDRLLNTKFGGAAMSYLVPLSLMSPRQDGPDTPVSAEIAWEFINEKREATNAAVKEYLELDNQEDRLDMAQALIAANFQIKPEAFGIAASNNRSIEAARQSLSVKKSKCLELVTPFQTAVRMILLGALEKHEATPRKWVLLDNLRTLTEASSAAYRAWSLAQAMHLLATNIENHGFPGQVQAEMTTLSQRIQVLLNPFREKLAALPYPYEHAKGEVTVLDYVLPKGETGDNDLEREFRKAQAYCEQLESLYRRLMGELCSLLLADAPAPESEVA